MSDGFCISFEPPHLGADKFIHRKNSAAAASAKRSP